MGSTVKDEAGCDICRVSDSLILAWHFGIFEHLIEHETV